MFRCYTITRLLLISALSSVPLLATAQSEKPSSRSPFAEDDPFAKRRQPRGERSPLDVTIEVTDPQGAPVPGTQIRGAGMVRPLQTGPRGTAVWSADANRLRILAAKSGGRLRLHLQPPETSNFPSESKLVDFVELLRNQRFKFGLHPGIKLAGTVTGKLDGQPIEGVEVVIQAADRATDQITHRVQTDREGKWSSVVPRRATSITLQGSIAGYRLDSWPSAEFDYARLVDMPASGDSIDGIDFQVEQISPLPVVVVNPDGEPVPGASVSGYRKRRLDPEIVVWESITDSVESDQYGIARLYLTEPSKQPPTVFVTVEIDRQSMSGRAPVKPTTSGAIRVVVEPPATIRGRILQHGQPAVGVPLVLYEATETKSGAWQTIAVRGEVKTDDRGQYKFEAPARLRYILALKDRDPAGRQRILHRSDATTPGHNPVGDLELAAVGSL